MDYLVRFTQVHETFRLAEIEALAVYHGMPLEILSYNPNVCPILPQNNTNILTEKPQSPFCVVKLPSAEAATKLVTRSILTKAIYEIWGRGQTYPALHSNVRSVSQHLWPAYKDVSFKFTIDTFQDTRTPAEQTARINAFRFLAFEGPIRMRGADHEFCIAEDYQFGADGKSGAEPAALYFGRLLGGGDRNAINKYDLKKRRYISTTSMDAELALVTANITLAGPGKLFYDPFVGTGSFPVACAHFGALAFGSDIDGRSIRGKGKTSLLANFEQYGITDQFGDSFVADLTNTPLRTARIFDGIVCDPPYGVREGLKVLGSRDPTKGKEPVFRDGKAHHT